MISLKRSAKMAVNRIRVLKYMATISILEYLSAHNILVKKHERNTTKVYPISGPKDYRTVCLFRCDVNFQFVMHRILSVCEKWYYPSWKKDEASNALLIVCNSIDEEVEVKMKASLNSFIFHPENFGEPIEVRGNRPFKYVSIDFPKFSGFNTCEDANMEIPSRVYTVDLSQATFMSAGRFNSKDFKGSFVGRALKRVYEDMVRHIENNMENINKLVSGVEETYDLGPFELVPDIVCAKCGSPVIRRKRSGDMFCLNYCYNGDLDLLRRQVSHVDWMKSCEHVRGAIKTLYDNYR